LTGDLDVKKKEKKKRIPPIPRPGFIITEEKTPALRGVFANRRPYEGKRKEKNPSASSSDSLEKKSKG